LGVDHLRDLSSLAWSHLRIRDALWNILISIKDAFELVPDVYVAWLVFVVQTLQMQENVPDLWDVFRNYPELLLGIVQAISLDVLNFVHRVLLLLSPLEFLV
jgi:hypothetical protein